MVPLENPAPTIQTAGLPNTDFESWFLRADRRLECQVTPTARMPKCCRWGEGNRSNVLTFPCEVDRRMRAKAGLLDTRDRFDQ